jgi:hypothetical protein
MPPLLRPALAAALALLASAASAQPAPAPILDLPLKASFHARADWRLTATQGPQVPGEQTANGEPEPGEITFCLQKAPTAPCAPVLGGPTRPGGEKDDYFDPPHYLRDARVVHGAGGRPYLLVQAASMYAGNSGQWVVTQLLAYNPAADAFVRVFNHGTGTNNNEDVRFLETGPLKGHIVSVEPTENAPFAYWITVLSPTKSGPYKQILHFRSNTRYGDGNPLSVIDSEMPETLKRLHLWRPGRPLPLPAGGCARPRLVAGALWCQ